MSTGCECLPEAIQVILLFIPMTFPGTPMLGAYGSKTMTCALYAAWVALYPVIYFLNEAHIQAHEKLDGYRRAGRKPRSIHPKFHRRRDISTTPLSNKPMDLACHLLALPRELREMIWIETVAGMDIKLSTLNGRCTGTKSRYGDNAIAWKMDWHKNNIIGLLTSCRQIYLETIHMLYAQNNFETRYAEVVAYLPRTLLSDRLNAIKSFRLDWLVTAPPSYPHQSRCSWTDQNERTKKVWKQDHYYRQTWFKVWETLAVMEGLETLRVELDTRAKGRHSPLSNTHLWDTAELEVVKMVLTPKKFELVLHEEFAERARKDIVAPNLEIISQIVTPY